MKRFFLCAMAVGASLVSSASEAQPAGSPCNALANRLTQSPAALEGRLLSEALFEAAALDCTQIAKEMLEKEATVAARNRRGATALWIAAEHGSRSVMQLLIAAGADIDRPDLGDITPILAATRAGRRKTVEDLLEAGADPSAADAQGVTPLMAAAFNGETRMVYTFIKAGVEIDAVDRQGKVALIYAAGRAFPAVVGKLIAAGADADGVWGHDLTPLMWAAGHANGAPAKDGIETAKLIIAAGADIHRRDDRGRDALMIAAERGHREMVAFLLEQDADPEARDKTGLRAADLAKSEAVRKLLQE